MITAEDFVQLPCEGISPSFMDYIYAALKKKEGSVSEKTGYFDKLIKINRIVDNKINPIDGSNIFLVNYTFEAKFPKIDEMYEGQILFSYPEAILIKTDFLHILIVNGTYDEFTKTHVFPCGCVFKRFDTVRFKLTDATYKFNNYNCIGYHDCRE